MRFELKSVQTIQFLNWQSNIFCKQKTIFSFEIKKKQNIRNMKEKIANKKKMEWWIGEGWAGWQRELGTGGGIGTRGLCTIPLKRFDWALRIHLTHSSFFTLWLFLCSFPSLSFFFLFFSIFPFFFFYPKFCSFNFLFLSSFFKNLFFIFLLLRYLFHFLLLLLIYHFLINIHIQWFVSKWRFHS